MNHAVQWDISTTVQNKTVPYSYCAATMIMSTILAFSINGQPISSKAAMAPEVTQNSIKIDSVATGLDSGLAVYNITIPQERTTVMAEKRPSQGDNLIRVESFKNLQENWDGAGASSISEHLINTVRGLVLALHVQPEIFPTADGSIQLEFDTKNGDYLEFEIFSDMTVCKLLRTSEGPSADMDVLDIQKMNEAVDALYGNGL